ncbi:LOW QUALITY PROTEIN: perilipin-3-like [Elgaria multicarinata webbii]|uniref:LOW QUALITY PROTEIN: perilipin-3-like n=1 Tax=Elgaria multicarinata webbii TaxID=159646 RepID=UPI002FCCF5C3
MSSKSPVKEAGEPTQENILRRVANMPLVSSAYDAAATAFSSTKDTHPYVKSLLDTAEKGVKILTEVALTIAQPILTKLEPQVAMASGYASEGLDTLAEKLPVLQLTVDKVASDTKEMVSSKMTSTKEALANQLFGVVDMTKEVVQGSMKATKSIISHSLTTVVESRVGQIAVRSAEAMLGRSEELIDDYLPITDEELALLSAVLTDGDMIPVRPYVQQEYLVRLGTLSVKLCHRAYQHSVAKLKRAQQAIQNSLSQLQQTLHLIEHTKQGVGDKGPKVADGQEKLIQMFREWKKANIKEKSEKDLAEACICVHVETQTLTMFRNMIQQLQAACQALLFSIQGFPSSLQDKVQQIRQSTKDLHSSFSAAGSFQELPGALLSQSYQRVQKAQEYLDELWEYIARNTPLSWLVGPFKLSEPAPFETGTRVE